MSVTSSVKGTRSFRYGTTSSSLRKPRSWELIPPSEGEDQEEEEEEPEEEDNPEGGIPATPSLPIDISAEDDYLRYIEKLEHPLEPTALHSSQASIPDVPVEAADRQADRCNGSSYELSGVWQSQSLSPSP
ncbi:hypothetical protein PIB30_023661 [Stylosanthes scabra]|uniref:Uncharacterized protein n=1 Tax=Stylosanthes scabra TaxID=79078 RepID=A0ABU6R9S1_9FABA|nr:hypothetical protein [Stylosanthes scabra]